MYMNEYPIIYVFVKYYLIDLISKKFGPLKTTMILNSAPVLFIWKEIVSCDPCAPALAKATPISLLLSPSNSLLYLSIYLSLHLSISSLPFPLFLPPSLTNTLKQYQCKTIFCSPKLNARPYTNAQARSQDFHQRGRQDSVIIAASYQTPAFVFGVFFGGLSVIHAYSHTHIHL